MEAEARAAPADSVGSTVIAVFEIRDTASALSEVDRRSLTRYLATKLVETGKYQVVPESEVRRALEEKKLESYAECYEEACQIEIGKEVAAQKSVVAEIVKLGDTCAVSAVLFDLAKSASEKAAAEKSLCAVEHLVLAVERVVARLANPEAPSNMSALTGEKEPRKSRRALSAMRYQFETRNPEYQFKVELLGSDGHRHDCSAEVTVGTSCSIDQVAIGDARLRVVAKGLTTYDRTMDIEPKNHLAIIRLQEIPSLGAIVSWTFGGMAMATGLSLIPVGIGEREAGFLWGGVPTLLVGTGLVVLGFFLEEDIGVREDILD
jgi:hypothetical protein